MSENIWLQLKSNKCDSPRWNLVCSGKFGNEVCMTKSTEILSCSEKPVQQHLKNVYSSLSICMLAAAAGGYVHLFTNIMQVRLNQVQFFELDHIQMTYFSSNTENCSVARQKKTLTV